MKKRRHLLEGIIFSAVAVLLLFIPLAIAAGGGGGGGGSSSQPACTDDTWTCTPWNGCARDGLQTRTCEMTVDCATVLTPKPAEQERCTYVSVILGELRCHNLPTVAERVSCRLDLSEEEQYEELKVAYLPEECRALDKIPDREDCVLLYGRSQPCWEKPQGPERAQCLKGLLGVSDIAAQKKACGVRGSCTAALRRNVHSLIKFQLYDLEERAEDLLEAGIAKKEDVVTVITELEEQKVVFNEAKSKAERKAVIEEVRALWEAFVAKVRADYGSR